MSPLQKFAEPSGCQDFADLSTAKPHGTIDDTVKCPPLQHGLDIGGLPVGQNRLRLDSGPRVNAIRDLDARFTGENDGGRKTLGAFLGLVQPKRLSERSVRVVGLVEPHRYVVVQQITSAIAERLVGRPLVKDALQDRMADPLGP